MGGSSFHASGDALGSVTELTDANKAVQQTYGFDAWGNLTASSGTISNPFRYTAREDDGSGLTYLRRGT